MAGLSITIAYQRLDEDGPLSIAAINAQWASLSLQLTGTINAALIPDQSITFPKLNKTVIVGAGAIPVAPGGGDKLLIDHAGALFYVTVTQLVATGLTWTARQLWDATDFVYGIPAGSGGVNSSGLISDVTNRIIEGTGVPQLGFGALDLVADKMLVHDASATTIPHPTGTNSGILVVDTVRQVTDRLFLTTADPASTSNYAIATGDGSVLLGGTRYVIKLHANCVQFPTLKLNTGGAAPIKRGAGVGIGAGDLSAGQIIEVVYDAVALAWIIIGPASQPGLAKAWFVFDSKATYYDTGHLDTNAAADTISGPDLGKFNNGDLCWVRSGNYPVPNGLESSTPYYVRKVTSTSMKLYRNKADALAGTGALVDITATLVGLTVLTYWGNTGGGTDGSIVITPLMASYNVDGVISGSNSQTDNRYRYVDFANDMPGAEYAIQLTQSFDTQYSGDSLIGVNRYEHFGSNPVRSGPTASGFDFFTVENANNGSQRCYGTIHG